MPRVRNILKPRNLAFAFCFLLAVYTVCYYLTESQWFDSLGYAAVWRVRSFAQFQIALLSITVLGSFMLGSVYLASRADFEHVPLPRAYRTFEEQLNRLRRTTLRFAYCVSIILPLLLTKLLCRHWQEWLLAIYGRRSQVPVPWGGYADTFSLYSLPFLRPLIGAWWCVILATGILVATIEAPRSFYQLLSPGRARGVKAWWHTLFVVAMLFATRALGYGLQCIESGLPQTGSLTLQQRILAGGQAACWLIAGISLASCLAVRFYPLALANRRWNWRTAILTAGVSGMALVVPSWVASAVSMPVGRLLAGTTNREAVSGRLEATKAAWGLAGLNEWGSSTLKSQRPETSVPAVPVWSAEDLMQTRLGGARPGPEFSPPQREVDYQKPGSRLIAVAAYDADSRPNSWAGTHLADEAAQTTGLMTVQLTRGPAGLLPAEANLDVRLDSMKLYYGRLRQQWLLSDSREAGAVDLSSWWRRASWAVRLRDLNLLLADKRYRYLLWRRSVAERMNALAPFLVAGGEPSAVMVQKRALWLGDGLSVSRTFPGSAAAGGETLQGYNAAFDSVKIVMDAGTGAINFYQARADAERDPMLRIWQQAFPGLIQPLQAMPWELRRHRRYPQVLFEAQASLLAKANKWQRARQYESFKKSGAGIRTLTSSYTLQHQDGRDRFVLQAPLISADETQIAAQLTADCDANYGELRLSRDGAGAPSPLAFTRELAPSILGEGTTAVSGAAMAANLNPDEHWAFGDVTVQPGREGESWLPVFRVSDSETSLAKVIVRRDKEVGAGASADEAYFDLLQHSKAPKPETNLTARELVAKASKLQTEAENAVRRGAMTEWSRLMDEQRATLLRLQGKLQASKDN